MHLDTHLDPMLHRLDDLALVEVLTGPRRQPQTGVHEEAQDYQSQSLATLSAMSEPQLAHALCGVSKFWPVQSQNSGRLLGQV